MTEIDNPFNKPTPFFYTIKPKSKNTLKVPPPKYSTKTYRLSDTIQYQQLLLDRLLNQQHYQSEHYQDPLHQTNSIQTYSHLILQTKQSFDKNNNPFFNKNINKALSQTYNDTTSAWYNQNQDKYKRFNIEPLRESSVIQNEYLFARRKHIFNKEKKLQTKDKNTNSYLQMPAFYENFNLTKSDKNLMSLNEDYQTIKKSPILKERQSEQKQPKQAYHRQTFHHTFGEGFYDIGFRKNTDRQNSGSDLVYSPFESQLVRKIQLESTKNELKGAKEEKEETYQKYNQQKKIRPSKEVFQQEEKQFHFEKESSSYPVSIQMKQKCYQLIPI